MYEEQRRGASRRAFLKAAGIAAATVTSLERLSPAGWADSPRSTRPGRRVSAHEVREFSRQFADLLEQSGLALLPILSRLAEQQRNPDFREIISQLRDDVKRGWSLSSAMERHARVFSAQYASTIREGELTGTLDLVLRRLGSVK